MTAIETVISETENRLGIQIPFLRAESDRDAIQMAEESGKYTLFRISYHGKSYVLGLSGKGKEQENYALLLPSYLESVSFSGAELTKEEFLKRILLGECPSSEIYKFMLKHSVKPAPCFVICLRVSPLSDDVLNLLVQYGGNPLDMAVRFDETNCALVKFFGEEEGEYRSPADFADFLAQSLKEELGIKVVAGVGSTVKSLKDVSSSYAQASSTLRFVDVFSKGEGVHYYKEYTLVHMLEDVPEARLSEYFEELTDEGAKEIFEDEEMVETAEEFLLSSLNVSETSRKLYMHRNTLLYRLDKIEKATGLNIREFPDAVSFRVLTILYRFLKK